LEDCKDGRSIGLDRTFGILRFILLVGVSLAASEKTAATGCFWNIVVRCRPTFCSLQVTDESLNRLGLMSQDSQFLLYFPTESPMNKQAEKCSCCHLLERSSTRSYATLAISMLSMYTVRGQSGPKATAKPALSGGLAGHFAKHPVDSHEGG